MIKIAMDVKQIEKAVMTLPIKTRIKLVERLLKVTRKDRFEKLRGSIRAKIKRHPISEGELNQIVEEAREEFHAQDRP